MFNVIAFLLKEEKFSPAQAVIIYFKFLESSGFLNDKRLWWNISQVLQKLVIYAIRSMLCDIFPFFLANSNSHVSLYISFTIDEKY